MLANVLASIAQFQSDQISARNKAIAARMRKLGRPLNGMKKIGYMLVGHANSRHWAPDPVERVILAEIQRLREEEAKSWQEISDEIACRCAQIDPRTEKFFKKAWSRSKCCHRYKRWLKIQEEESLAEAASQTCR